MFKLVVVCACVLADTSIDGEAVCFRRDAGI